MKRKLLSLLMALVMTISLLPAPALAAAYQDTTGHWAEDAIDRWSGLGIIQGNNGKFNPGNALTRAHMATILSRLLKLPAASSAGFRDVAADAWYADAINRCAAAGIMLGNNGYANPDATITRQQAVVMLARALQIEPITNPDLSGYTDADQVSSYALGYMAAMAEAGIVGGTSATTLSPYANITRAATVVILHRAVDVYANKDGETVKAKGKGLVLVVAKDVKVTAPEGTTVVVPAHISGTTVNGYAIAGGQAHSAVTAPSGGSSSGSYIPAPPTPPAPEVPDPEIRDLTIAYSETEDTTFVDGGTYNNIIIDSSVGDGEVTLKDVTIKGNLIIRGGGSNTIRLEGCRVHGKVNIDKPSSAGTQTPRLHLTDTPVPAVEATSPAIIEAGDSNSSVGKLEASDDVKIQGSNTKIEEVTVPSNTSSSVTVAEGATVTTVAVSPDSTASIKAEAGATINAVDAKGTTTIDAVGTVANVSAAAPVTIESGSVAKVEVPVGETAKVTVSEGAAVAAVDAKGTTTIEASGAVEKVSAAAPVTIESGSVEKVEVPAGKAAEVTVTSSASVISVDAKGETTIKANGTVNNVTATASVTVSAGKVDRVEVPETATGAVSVTVSDTATVSDVTVNTTNDVTINANNASSVGSVSTDKDDGGKVGKVTVIGGGNESSQQPSSHNWGPWTPDPANNSHYRLCQGHKNNQHKQIDVHVWGEGSVTKEPSCTEAGVITYTCSYCNGTKTSTVSPVGHTIVVDAYKRPTCVEDGLTEGKHCSTCKTVLVKQEVIKATGKHTYDDDNDFDCNVCGGFRDVAYENVYVRTFFREGFETDQLKIVGGEPVFKDVSFDAAACKNHLRSGWSYGGWLVVIESADGQDKTYGTYTALNAELKQKILDAVRNGDTISFDLPRASSGTNPNGFDLVFDHSSGDMAYTLLVPDKAEDMYHLNFLCLDRAEQYSCSVSKYNAKAYSALIWAALLPVEGYYDAVEVYKEGASGEEFVACWHLKGGFFADLGNGVLNDSPVVTIDFSRSTTNSICYVISGINSKCTYQLSDFDANGQGSMYVLGDADAEGKLYLYTAPEDALGSNVTLYGTHALKVDGNYIFEVAQPLSITAPAYDSSDLFDYLIEEAEKLGLLKYIDENTLKEGKGITRAQISMLTGALLNVDIDKIDTSLSFSDIQNLPAPQQAVILALSSAGYIGGYPDGTFRPNDMLTRGAGAKLLSYAALGREKADTLTATHTVFEDVDDTTALAPYIEWSAVNGITSGDHNNNFYPYNTLTIEDALQWFINAARSFDTELIYLIAEAEKLGLLKYLDKTTLKAGENVTRLQIAMLDGALLNVNTASAPAWSFSDGKDLTAQQQAVIMVLNRNGYIGGYADGTFLPHASLTRGAGAKLLTYAILDRQQADNLEAFYNIFNDVDDTVALAAYIEWAASYGIVDGYGDGTFRPYNAITIEDALRWFINAASQRNNLEKLIAEAESLGLFKYLDKSTLVAGCNASRLQISMLLGALLKVSTATAPAWDFSDGKDLSAQQQAVIMVLNRNGYIGGYADGTFRPDVIPTRGAGAKLLTYAILDRQQADNLEAFYNIFNDVDDTVALAAYIEWAASYGIVDGYGDGTFRPYNAITIEDALQWFINAARQMDKSFLVTNIRFEDQFIKWDQPTAVTDDMGIHYEVRVLGNTIRSNCGTGNLFVANYAFSKGEYDRIEISTVVNGREMATAVASIDLTINRSTSSATPVAAKAEIRDNGDLIGYTVSLTGLTPNTSHTVHLTNSAVEWGWDSANFQEGVSDANGNLSLNFYGRDAIEFATNGYLFVFEQTANNVISKNEAVTSVATVIQPESADYSVRDIRMERETFICWNAPSNLPNGNVRYELALSKDNGSSWVFSTYTSDCDFFAVYLPEGKYNAVRVLTLIDSQPVGKAEEKLDITITMTTGTAAHVYFAPNGSKYSMLIGDLSSNTPIDIALSKNDSFNGEWCSFGEQSNDAGIAVRNDLENPHMDLNDLLTNGYYYLVEYDSQDYGPSKAVINVTERGGWIKATLSGSLPAEYAVSNIRITPDGYLRWNAALNAEDLRYRIHLNDGSSWNEDGGTNSNFFPLMAFCRDRDSANPGDMDTMTYYNVRIETFDSTNVSRATTDASDLMLTVNTEYVSSTPTVTLNPYTDNGRTCYTATVSGLAENTLYLMRARVADDNSYRGDFVTAIADSKGVAHFELRSDDAANIIQNGEYKLVTLDQLYYDNNQDLYVCTVISPCNWTKFTLNP